MPLQQVRIAESITAELRVRILSADEGAVLPKQDELVAEFQVSYPSVREALRILETEGLISTAYSLGLALQATKYPLSDLSDAVVCQPARDLDPGSAWTIPSEQHSASQMLYALTSEWEPTA